MRPWVLILCLVSAVELSMGQDDSGSTLSAPTYTPIGCYRDTGERDLPMLVEVKTTTIYRCRDKCRKLRYRYAGIQYSDYCFCGNKYGRYGKDADSECVMKCNANPTLLCGGVWHSSVYTTGVGEAAVAIKTLGCYTDKGERDLPFLSGGPIDVNSCLKRCGDLGYKYAGLQYGSQCWCGSTYGRYGKDADSECSMPCAANRQQLCGGLWHSHIYETGFTPVDRENLGCYIDQGVRDMLEIKGGMASIEYCVRYCGKMGYKFAGLQYSSYCFCGNEYGRYGKGDASTCNMACNGKKDEICGGVWRNNVYATGRDADEFNSLGCYNDKGVRDLPWLAKAGAITLNNCRYECASYGYLYFGVQNSDQCWCGNSYGKYGKADDTACAKPCIGNNKQICGGYFLQNIYPTNVQANEGSDSGTNAQSASDDRERALNQGTSDNSGKVVTISQIQMRSYGCYKDNGERDLPQNAFVGTLSIHYCRWTCRQLKYRYFGLQYTSYCFCGNSFGQYGQGQESNCNFKCAANKEQTCGGTWFNSLYSTGITAGDAELKPLGCFVDKGERDLPLLGTHCPIISINTCVQTCADLGYKYAGAQAGSQCFCGNKYGRYGRAKDSDCYVRCHANRRQICGGIWNQHIYETKADITYPDTIGCYKDQGVRDMVELVFTGMISINYCRKLCRNLGYRYAGVQYSMQCFCGNKYGRYGKAEPSQCNMKCTGYADQICGGVWHNNIYESGRPAFVFKSMGCYNDKVVRDLPFLAKIGLINLNNCRQACWRYGFRYFGVQNGNLCHCGDTYNKYGRVDDVRCQKKCQGNAEQICGDYWLNNIYETGIGGDDEGDYTRETEETKPDETKTDETKTDETKTDGKVQPDETTSTVVDGQNDKEVSIDKDTDGVVDTTIKHYGCFNDKADRDLPDLVYTGTVTIQLCVRMCARRLYRYAGLQGGTQCFCGNTYGRHGKADSQASCNSRCRGNAQQFCGGNNFITIYSTAVSWKLTSKGCFVDKATRDLPVLAMSGPISVNRCFYRCRNLGYYYAGVQNAMQCFCGDFYNRYGKAPDGKCNLKCRGNKAQTCGGVWAQSIYRTNYKDTTRTALGCFKDSDDHDLPHLAKTGLMSVSLCIQECSDLGYKYAGLQAGDKCFCGNSYSRYGKGEDTICTNMCSGNNNQMCGGAGYNLVFETGATVIEFTNLGCFVDQKDARDLPFLAIRRKANLNSCRASCADYGFLYFGVQNGGECWCGNKYGRHQKADSESACSMKCSGNLAETCGGRFVQNIYSTGLSTETVIISEGISETESISGSANFLIGGDISSTTQISGTTTNVDGGTTVISYEYIWTIIGSDALDQLSFGCFKDAAERDLPTLAVTSTSLTVKDCVKLCQTKKFKFAGLQNSKECWCGKEFGKYGPANDKNCNKPCAGDATKMCGGDWHNSIYTTSLENLQGIATYVLPAPTPKVTTKTITKTITITTTDDGTGNPVTVTSESDQQQ